MNKKQIEALAWYIYSGGGTNEYGDVRFMLEDKNMEKYKMTNYEKHAVADRVSDIRIMIEQKAIKMYDKSFKDKK